MAEAVGGPRTPASISSRFRFCVYRHSRDRHGSMLAYPRPMSADRDTYRVGGSLAETSRATGFAIVTLTYVVAGLAAAALVAALRAGHPLLLTLYGDILATLVVFAASVAVAN